MNGLDLFSGIGGIALALKEWVRPVAYCEIDRYAQAVLLSRMADGRLPRGPIWDDVTSLRGAMLPGVDIIYGGFPCQDISAAGLGAGLGGERSGLFQHIARLVSETNPRFVFLENVPAIRTRGLNGVCQTFTELGYDCRWTIVSAKEVGAPHLRKRWFMLAGNNLLRGQDKPGDFCKKTGAKSKGWNESRSICKTLAHTTGEGLPIIQGRAPWSEITGRRALAGSGWWDTEPDVGRVADGISQRVDRLRGLGNSVVPLQAKTAFERLMRIEEKS